MNLEEIFEVSTKELNLKNICRTCLGVGDMHSIYNESINQGTSIQEMLLCCTSTEVKLETYPKNHNIPSQICSKCLEELSNAYKFFMKCENSYNFLVDYKSDSKKVKTKSHQSINEENNTNDLVTIIKTEDDNSLTNEITNFECRNSNNKIVETIKIEPVDSKTNEILLKKICEKKNDIKSKSKTCKNLRKSKTYNCKRCSEQFNSFQELTEHRKIVNHPKLAKKNCTICGKNILSKCMKKHLRIHSKEKPFSCEHCGMRFLVNFNLQRHIYAKHSEIKPYNCNICGKGFPCSNLLKVHMRSHTGERPYVCNFCSKDFAESSNFRKHMATHNEKGPASKSDKSTKQEGETILYPCPDCNQSFDSKQQLQNHSLCHGERKFLCQFCGKDFFRNACLQSHLNIHTGEKKYTCKICFKSFSHPGTLKTHMLVHTGLKAHICSVCGKQFKQIAHLKYHLQTHSGEKPFNCDYCGKNFASNGTLTVHKRIHTGETPFRCSVCDKGFYDSTGLRKHKKIHPELVENL